MKRLEEFYCQECRNYFTTYLRDNFFGNYTIVCPNPKCQHQHFRVIINGVVTEERHQKMYGETTKIRPLKSTMRKKAYHNDPNFKSQQNHIY